VANSTSATFLRVVGSELIQKYLGDGPKLVRELFRVADDLSPSIVFIDEIDAIGTKRYVHCNFYLGGFVTSKGRPRKFSSSTAKKLGLIGRHQLLSVLIDYFVRHNL